MSWSVRGVENDAREQALEAAREAGVPVGEWLNELILSRSGAAPSSDPESLRDRVERLSNSATTATPARRAPAARSGTEADVRQIAEIAKALDALLERSSGHEASHAAPRSAPAREAAPARSRDTAPAKPASPARTNRVERVLATLEDLDRRVRSLSERGGGTRQDPALADGEGYDDSMPAHSSHERSLKSAIEEISARKNDLSARGDARQPSRPAATAQPDRAQSDRGQGNIDRHFSELARQIDSLRDPAEDRLADLRAEMAELRKAITGRERDGSSRRDLKDVRRLSDLIEEMRGETADAAAIADLRSEIANLREAVIDNNVEGTLQTLELGYAHIVQRLDELRRMTGDTHMLKGLDGRLADIESTLSSLPRYGEFTGLEDKLLRLSDRVEEAAARSGGADIAYLEGELQRLHRMIGDLDVRDAVRSVDECLRSVADRIDEVERSMQSAGDVGERISAMEDRLPATDAFDRLNHRLERICTMLSEDRSAKQENALDDRLTEIVSRLDTIAARPQESGQVESILSLLENRLDTLNAKLDEIDEKTLGHEALDAAVKRIDDALDRIPGAQRFEELQLEISSLIARMSGDGAAPSDSGALDALRREVSDLRQDFAQPERLASLLEPQIQELARTLMSGDRLNTDDATLARIEQQIAVIAGQLDATEDRLSGLGDMEATLNKIGGALSEERAGSQSAERNDDIDALRGDLNKLMKAAGAATLDDDADIVDIQAALNRIVARLMALESDATQMRGDIALEGEQQAAMAVPAIAVGGGGGSRAARVPAPAGRGPDGPSARDSGAPAPKGKAPAVPSPAAAPRSRRDEQPALHDDLPLEPGSGKPDIAALLREHNEGRTQRVQRVETDDNAGPRDRKADFIAAARRAAQAAAAEVTAERLGSPQAPEEMPERGGWLRSKLKRSASDKAQTAEIAAGTDAEISDIEAASETTDAATAEKQPRFRRFRRVLRSRRPLVLAAAAVILAIGALKMTPADKLERVANLFSGPAATSSVEQAAFGPAGGAAPVLGRVAPDGVGQASGTAGLSSTGPGMPDAKVTFDPPAAPPDTFKDARTPEAAAPIAPQPPVTASDPAPATTESTGTLTVEPQRSAPPAIASTAPAQLEGAGQDIGLSAPLPEEAVGPMSLRMAAANGNPRAQFEIAARYTEGRGVVADPAKAAEWYRRAAEGGLAPAQYRLGSLYEKGRGIERNKDAARSWYERAAAQGNAKAMHNLAVLYAEGGAGSAEFEKATKWFKRASQLGVRDSQFNLGILYARGFGVDRDMIESYRWFALAALQGDNDAGAKRDEIAKLLAPQDLEAAKLLVSTWQADPLKDAANTVPVDAAWTDAPAKVSSLAPQELVLEAQLLLGELGYDAGPADGVVGPKTRDAVKSFQRSVGLPETGSIDSKLIRALGGRSI